MTSSTIRTILAHERAGHSVNGNPAYRFFFDDEPTRSCRSTSDASWCYAVGNPGMREGSRVAVEMTRAGRIRAMEPVVTLLPADDN